MVCQKDLDQEYFLDIEGAAIVHLSSAALLLYRNL